MSTLSVEEIVSNVKNMPVMELSRLVKALRDEFGIQAVPMSAAPAAGAAPVAGAEAAKEEQTSFTVVLAKAGANRIPIIKVVREIAGLGLKEAKDLVDGAPKNIKENVSKEEAESIKAKFAGTEATVEIQ